MALRDVGAGGGAAVGANRGASGIDGVLSSAAGFAEGLGRGTTLVVGDVSFLHDVNGLNLLRTSAARPPLTVRRTGPAAPAPARRSCLRRVATCRAAPPLTGHSASCCLHLQPLQGPSTFWSRMLNVCAGGLSRQAECECT